MQIGVEGYELSDSHYRRTTAGTMSQKLPYFRADPKAEKVLVEIGKKSGFPIAYEKIQQC